MNLQQWAHRWQLPAAALKELADLSIPELPYSSVPSVDKSEAWVQSKVRLEAAYATPKTYLWRNNNGAGAIVNPSKLCPNCRELAKRMVRWGLANDSHKLNDVIKSADLIGGRSELITPQMVGTYVMRFISRECKHPKWGYTGTSAEQAQLAWATLINSLGGDAKIVNSTGSL